MGHTMSSGLIIDHSFRDVNLIIEKNINHPNIALNYFIKNILILETSPMALQGQRYMNTIVH